MNNRIPVLASLVVMAALSGTSRAQEATPIPESTVTMSRAEVLADLEIWREAGLATFSVGEGTDNTSRAFRDAEARYAALRSSTGFGERVARIARQRNERVATLTQERG
jgi:hypothetical protein